MRIYDNGSFYTVSVSAREIRDFADTWPCSGMRGAARGMSFQYDKRNGDLVDIRGERPGYDEGAVEALSEDAQTFGAARFVCTNCAGPLPSGHATADKSGKHHFCDACAAIAEALFIGARQPVMLYDNGADSATSWTGGIMGRIVHKHAPGEYRHFGTGNGPFLTTRGGMRGAVRYRVLMLDGSMWCGTGPTDNGNYIRLRPMKGE